MSQLDEMFSARSVLWWWPLPHPSDPERPSSRERRTRIGRRDATGGFEGLAEITSTPARLVGGWNHRLTAVGGRRPPELGSITFEHNSDGDLRGGAVKSPDGHRVRWSVDGRVDLAGTVDCNNLMTRGGPVRDSVERPTLAETWRDLRDGASRLGALFRGASDDATSDRADTDVSSEMNTGSSAETATGRLRFIEVVPEELTAFDGWMRARQHRETASPAEAWEAHIDLERSAPGPVGLAVVVAAAATAHRRILGYPDDGLLFYLGS